MKHSELVHPKHCFCQIELEDLKPWVIERFVKNRKTIDLLNSTDDPREREIISIISLLDVEEEYMLNMMGDVDLPQHHIIHCRENVKKILLKT